MATSVATNFITVDGYTCTAFVTITLTGNYGTGSSHGDPLNLSGLQYQGMTIPANALPLAADFQENPPFGTAATGYSFGLATGSTLSGCGLTVFNGTSEYSQGSAYSAGLLSAVIKAELQFTTFVS